MYSEIAIFKNFITYNSRHQSPPNLDGLFKIMILMDFAKVKVLWATYHYVYETIRLMKLSHGPQVIRWLLLLSLWNTLEDHPLEVGTILNLYVSIRG